MRLRERAGDKDILSLDSMDTIKTYTRAHIRHTSLARIHCSTRRLWHTRLRHTTYMFHPTLRLPSIATSAAASSLALSPGDQLFHMSRDAGPRAVGSPSVTRPAVYLGSVLLL